VQINTAVRPPAEAGLRAPGAQRLEEVRRMLGPRAELIAPAKGLEMGPAGRARQGEITALLKRRPCTLEDIAGGLGIHPNDAVKYVQSLLDGGAIRRRQQLYRTYYEAARED
jgi:hypothetical protein